MRRAIAVAAGLAAILIAPAGASAAVQCGDRITEDVRLNRNLDCSTFAGPALTVDANGVEVDLNGRRLIGPTSSYNGIDSVAGVKNLTVRDGTIRGFANAINLPRNERVTLSNLDIELAGVTAAYGVNAGQQKHLHMSHLTIDNSFYGVYIYDSKDVRLRHSKFTGSDSSTYAVYIGSADRNTTGLIDDVKANGAEYGFYIYGDTTDFEITDSTASNGGYAGFFIDNQEPGDYTLKRNTANNNADYGLFAAYRVRGSGNEASGNGFRDCRKVPCL